MAFVTKVSSSLAIALLAASASASTLVIPLEQSQAQIDPIQHAVHAAARHSSRLTSSCIPTAAESLDGGFWFGSLDVGNGRNLSLLIDTGSSDIGINPGRYNASSASKKLPYSGEYNYITTLKDGCGQSSISYDSYNDTVSFQGLKAKNQALYAIKKKAPPSPGVVTQIKRDGIVGMSGNKFDGLGIPFFYNLCQQKQVKSCRFGLAYGTNGKGRQFLGGLETSAFKGPMTRVPVQTQWYGTGNVAVNGKALIKGINIVFDSGTAGIVAPASQVRAYFQAAGITAKTVNAPGCVNGVFGYYACDKPPNLGFQLGPQNTTFNMLPSAFKLQDNGNNNCTVWVTGLADSTLPKNFWIVGQNWMQGKYIDFDYTSNSVGVALAK